MTLPTSLTKTFDTSLVDVNRSFSSTNTDTSGSSSSVKENQKPQLCLVPELSTDPTGRAVSTSDLYDRWAATHDDMDGAVLQAVDDMQMREWIPQLVSALQQRAGRKTGRAIAVLDVECRTGRNMLELLQQQWSTPTTVVGWDASPAMLEVARERWASVQTKSQPSSVARGHWEAVDFSNPKSISSIYERAFDGLISTLALEHIELSAFFAVVAKVLRPGGCAFVTNMHPEMGRRIQIRYKTEEGGRRGETSYLHGVEATVVGAKAAGLEVLGNGAEEVAVSEEMVKKGLVDERGRKWVGVKVWYGLWLRAPDEVR